MKKLRSILILSLVLFLAFSVYADQLPDAQTLFSMILDGKCEQAWQFADETMRSSLPADAANQAVASLGTVTGHQLIGQDEAEGYFRYFFQVSQSSGEYLYTLVLNGSGMISGFFISPYQVPKTKTEDASSFVTEEVVFRKGEPDETVAKLVLPNAEGSFPVGILIPGSGPCNEDETSYGISPFRDLAEGLAAYGIATLRFDKYSLAHSQLLTSDPEFTIEQEYLLDAKAAFLSMQEHERIDGIYLLGHSQGAMLLPRIIHTLGGEQIAGGISVCGSPLHLWELQYNQNIDLWGNLPEDQQDAALSLILQEAEKATALAGMDREDIPNETVFGISSFYQWDEMQYDAIQLAKENQVPMLFLQGDADFQIPTADGYELWKAAYPEADYILLPGVTHMLTKVEAYTGTTDDYISGANVDQEVIEAIAQWILSGRSS